MTTNTVSAAVLFAKWRQDPDYVAAYDALEEEFSLASALIEARGKAGMTQEEVAVRMGTTQTAIARLEGGRSKPSTRTLQRFAAATGSKLCISFAPKTAASDQGPSCPPLACLAKASSEAIREP